MSKQTGWQKLDTASNIFLAAVNELDTKVFRLSVAFFDDINAEILKRAVNLAYDNFPLYHYTIRDGMFWHYLEESNLKPEITEENTPPCARIYEPDRKKLLFLVNYSRKRINLEVFHALSDGTGVIEFMKQILYFYCREKYPEANIEAPKVQSSEEYMTDAFERYFKHYSQQSIFKQNINDATGNLKNKIYQVKGIRTEDLRTNILETLVDVNEILKISKSYGITLTEFLTALFIYATYLDAPKKETTTISATVPINLRRFFPTGSSRNFFSTMMVYYTFKGGETFDVVAESIQRQFQENLTKERIIKKQMSIINFENSGFVKTIPAGIKDFILNIVNNSSNKKITLSASNVGVMPIDKAYGEYIHHMSYMVSSVRPQFVSTTFNNILSLSFSSPYQETAIFKNFCDFLTDRGVKITIYTNNI